MIYEKDFIDSITREKEFLLAVKRDGRIPKELDVMAEMYKKLLEGLVTLRYDVEIYARLMEKDPENKLVLPDENGRKTDWVVSRNQSQIVLEVREQVIEVIREQIIIKYKKEREPRE